jgi:hypothetical protein
LKIPKGQCETVKFGNPFIGGAQSRLVLPRNIMEPFKLIQTEYVYFVQRLKDNLFQSTLKQFEDP